MPRTPSQDVERALVDAAEAVLVREGPAGVTVRAVAAEAGVAPMGVYNRFGGKDGLVSAILVARAFELLPRPDLGTARRRTRGAAAGPAASATVRSPWPIPSTTR